MKVAPRITIGVILFCQFIAALSALGMPPFYSLFLKKTYGAEALIWGIPLAGILFVVPTFFAGLTSPYWGKMADRYGKKKLLLRAQLGLSLSFLAAGYSTTAFQFFLALLVQGILGGTFAASKAYLATLIKGEHLAEGLTLMEASPRAALVVGPFLLGYLMESSSPIRIYRVLAILPFLSAIITLFLPSDSPKLNKSRDRASLDPGPTPSKTPNLLESTPPHKITPSTIMILQFAFGTAAVMISPYFNLAMNQRFPFLSQGQLGLIFGLPHITYLACAAPFSKVIHKVIKKYRLIDILIAAFTVQGVTIWGQAQAHSIPALITYRLLSGASMTAIFIGLHLMISGWVSPKNAGNIFGRLEQVIRFSYVVGGISASVCFGYFGTKTLFYISSTTLGLTSLYLFYVSISQRKEILV